jgi:hypothetical protein
MRRSELKVSTADFGRFARNAKMAVASGYYIEFVALNRWSVVPAIRDHVSNASRNLAHNLGAEIALGFSVVGLAGVLGLMPPQ